MNQFIHCIKSFYKNLVICGFCLISSVAYCNTVAPFNSSAKYACLMDYDTGEVIFNHNATESMAPSSMTKIMTAYVVFEQLKLGAFKLSDTISISEYAAKQGGSKMFIIPKQKISIEDLLHGMIVVSGNDASVALAEGMFGTEESFVSKMNAVAKSMNLSETVFQNSTGWPQDGHITSARDIAILTRRLIQDFPEYYHYHALKSFTFNKIHQMNRNRLLGLIGVDGVKTGKSSVAGYGVAVSAKRDTRRLVAVVNGLKSDQERMNEAARLLEYGFRYFKNIRIFNADENVDKILVKYGDLNHVSIKVLQNVHITVPIAFNKEKDLILHITKPNIIDAPIKAGDVLGSLKVSANKDNDFIKEFTLVAANDVHRAGFWKRVYQYILYRVRAITNS